LLQQILRLKKYDKDLYKALDPISERSLYELIDYIKENDLNVLFVDTPQSNNKKKMGRSNTVYKILEKEGMPYLHHFTEDSENGLSIDLDFKSEFYNSSHVNYIGAVKYTKILAEYLDENYDLTDRRNDSKAQKDWDGVNAALIKKMKTLEKSKETK